MPESGAELLARVKPRLREESTYLCLRPDLLDEHAELEAELRDLRAEWDGRPRRNADKMPPELVAKAQRLVEVEAEIEATQIKVTLRALSKDAWQALCDRHAPRKGDNLDAYAGYNRDAVIESAMRDGMIDPVFEDCDDQPECGHSDCGSWQQFASVLNRSEWDELRRLVASVNRVVNGGPKSVLASRILGRDDSASQPPAPGE